MRLFGYTAEEAVGQKITILISETRLSGSAIVAGIQAVSESITVRRRKGRTLPTVELDFWDAKIQ